MQQELTIRIALGTPLVLTKGHAAPEVERTYTRALTLCQQLGDTPQLFPVLLGLRRFYGTGGELQTAYKLGEQLLNLAQHLQEPPLLIRAHAMQAELLMRLGKFSQSRTHTEQGLALYDPRQHRAHIFLFGNDSGVGNGVHMAGSLCILGYLDQSVSKLNEALVLAQEIAHPFDTTRALFFAALVAQFRRELHLVRERAETVIALAAEHGFALYSAWGPILRGWVLAEDGQVNEGILHIHQGLNTLQTMGAQVFRTYWLALLADAYGKAGQSEEGLKVVTESLELVEKTGERWCEAELYRLKGVLTLKQSSVQSLASGVTGPHPPTLSTQAETEAESYFLKALAVARQQQAKSIELRAVISLAHLWQSQDKKNEAHQLLAELYNWFTEGFDTPDLKEARALLEELGGSRCPPLMNS